MNTERYVKLYGANCPSCAYTIERVGKRLPKVRDIQVDTAAARVNVVFDSSDEQEQKVTLAKLVEVIQRIGYDATVETPGVSTEQ